MSNFIARFGLCFSLCAVVTFACTSDQAVMQAGLPGARAAVTLSLVAERGDHLDVVMEGGSSRYRFFLPNDEPCRSLFAGEPALTYANAGPFGRLQAGEAVCDPVGILSLPEWRNRRSHRRVGEAVPRDRAQLDERVYVDEELAVIRGRFRLASHIGIVGGADLLAVVPNSPECKDLTVPGVAAMEYRPVGKQVFTLVEGGRLCQIIGFALPPANSGR